MTREEAEKEIRDNFTEVWADGIIKALEQEPVIDKIRAEIEQQEKWLMDAGYNQYNVDIAFNAIKLMVNKYKGESER